MKTKSYIVIMLLLFIIFKSFSQNRIGSIEHHINSILNDMPGSLGNDYQAPLVAQIDTWGNTISNILTGNLSVARQYANSINYSIVEFIDTTLSQDQFLYVLEEKSPQSNYWGTYVFNSAACRSNLVIQSPHPKHDSQTGSQGIYCFKRLSARAFFLSGTHRCNHSSASSCSGTTTACNDSSSSFRISDMSHNSATMYQKTTEILYHEIPNSVFIQLHGFDKQPTDPYVIISNGTRNVPAVDYVVQLKDQLYLTDPTLTFKLAHIDTDWAQLVGFTNVQGRYVNESSDPCNTPASISTGRFIHIEQERTKLREDSVGWYKMYVSLANVFACSTVSIDNIRVSDTLEIFPSPSTGIFAIKGKNIRLIEIVNLNGKKILTRKCNADIVIIDISAELKGVYFIKIQTGTGLSVKKIILI